MYYIVLSISNVIWFLHACVLAQSLSHVQLFQTPWTVACQVPLFHGIFQARILEQVFISYSMESSWLKDQTHISWVSCISRQILYHWATWEVQVFSYCMCIITFFSKILFWCYCNTKTLLILFSHCLQSFVSLFCSINSSLISPVLNGFSYYGFKRNLKVNTRSCLIFFILVPF